MYYHRSQQYWSLASNPDENQPIVTVTVIEYLSELSKKAEQLPTSQPTDPDKEVVYRM